jgi:ferredoxin-NADP reductase
MPVSEDKFYRARVTHRQDLAPDLWVIRIDSGGPFTFASGQYGTLGLDTLAKGIERAYSIVSAPFENEIEIFTNVFEGGLDGDSGYTKQ